MGKTTSDPPFFMRPGGDPDDLAEALKRSQELLALAEQSGGIGIWDTDLATDMVRATPTFFCLMGLPVAAGPIANDVVRAVRHPDDAARVRDGFLDALARGVDSYEVEYRIIRPSDGELRWIFGRGRTVRDGGTPVRYSGVDIDITERKRAEEHVRLLMNELNHRANNLLTVVQALAHQTADSADAKAFAKRLSQRVAGLAASNSLLISGKWQGVELATLVRSQLAPFVVDLDRRVVLAGPSLRLMPAAAQAVGMALHELATNAVKHGALAAGDGRIRVDWSVEERAGQAAFSMAWVEEGGPPVDKPRRSGFGRTVIERMIAQALEGAATLDFAPGGIAWRFTCPAHRALEEAGAGA
jgi:PAS domain S-box-containing protein